MAKSSINFQKAKSNSVEETTRQFKANYLLPKEFQQNNEYWNCGKSDAEVFAEQLQIANRKGGRIPKSENSLWEAVINLNIYHNMQDVQKVAQHIEQKFNIICTRIAIHRDEGKVLDDGTVKYNYHAHLNFVTYKNGRQNWRRQFIRRKDLSALQSEVAEILGMERGQVNSTSIRANHRELRKNYDSIMKQRKAQEILKPYKETIEFLQKEAKKSGVEIKNPSNARQFIQNLQKQKEQKEPVKESFVDKILEVLSVSKLKKEIQTLRNELKQKNAQLEQKNKQKVYTQQDYIALNKLKKELNKNNLQEIYKDFLNLKEELRSKTTDNKKLREELLNKNVEISLLQEKLKSYPTPSPSAQGADQGEESDENEESELNEKDEKIEELKAENKELKSENEELKNLLEQLQDNYNQIHQKLIEIQEEIEQLKDKNTRLKAENTKLQDKNAKLKKNQKSKGKSQGITP